MNISDQIDYDFLISECKEFAKLDDKNKTITLTQKQYCELRGGYFFLIQELMLRGFRLFMED